MPRREASELQRAECDTLEIDYFVSCASEHATNFAVLSFAESKLQKRALALRSDATDVLGAESAFGEMRAPFELGQHFPRRRTGDLDSINASQSITRMREPIGQFSVVGDKQQTAAVFIQPPDGE